MTDTPTGGLTVTGATGTASVEAIFFDVVAVNRETNARQMHRMGMTKTAAEKLVAQISEKYGVHEEFYEAAPTVLVSAPATITTDRRCGTCRYWEGRMVEQIEWLPIDQYEMDGTIVLLRWQHGYAMQGSGREGRKSRDNMPLDGRALPTIEGRGPLMFARLPLRRIGNGGDDNA